MADLPGLHQRRHALDLLADRRARRILLRARVEPGRAEHRHVALRPMDLVQVDVLDLQAREAGVDRLGDVRRASGRCARRAPSRAGPGRRPCSRSRACRGRCAAPASCRGRSRCGPGSRAFGGTGYISAVSMKLTPCATAKSSCTCASASLFCSPQVIVPRQTSETSRSVLGNRRCFTADSGDDERERKPTGCTRCRARARERGLPPGVVDGLQDDDDESSAR